MARLKDSRSPSPAGSHSARKRKDDDRRDRDRRDGNRDYRRRSGSPIDRRHRERSRERDRDRGRDGRDDRGGRDRDYHRRDRSVGRRDDDYRRGPRRDVVDGRDRRRSRDRGVPDRVRSPDRRRPRSRDRDRDHRSKRDDSRDRAVRPRRDSSADSTRHQRGGDDRSRGGQRHADGVPGKENEPAKSTPAQPQSEADKKAERLRRLQAMKEKHALKEAKEADVSAGSTRKLLAEMDQKASGASSPAPKPSPTPSSPVASASPATPATPAPYAGKFDPKAIAQKSKAARAPSPTRLGDVKLGDVKIGPAAGNVLAPKVGAVPKKAGLLPTNRVMSTFGFGKAPADSLKKSPKRKLDMDDEETTKRKLVKLPSFALENADTTPYTDDAAEDEDGEDDIDDLLARRNEEDAVEARRILNERREERIQKESMAMEVDSAEPITNGEVKAEPTPQEETAMDVDADIDPLDAFMANLDQSGPKAATQMDGKKAQEPETYFSEDDYGYEAEGADPSSILAMAAKKKKKDIPTVDYSKLDLNPIRKNFWVEPHELSQLTEEEAAELRLELDGIKVSGKDVPRPVQKWSQCGLARPVLDAIESLGYEKPTPIQMQALPVIMSGRDVIGVAKTGSGKTMAFVLPMLRHIMDQDPVTGDDGAIALIMTPTRELCTQIYSDIQPFAKKLKLRAVAAYGGAAIKDQIAELKRGAEIVVATPGRMIDLLAANQGRVTNLRRVTYIVLDEADRMFDMGFEPQVMKIFNNIRPDRQTILFSATMPRIIDALTKKVLKTPVEITVGGRSVVAPEITQIVEVMEEKQKFVRLLELLGDLYVDDDDVRALIFVERQEKADDLLRELLRRGYGCMSIHGGKDQEDRNSTISDFKKGVCPIMIATSVAARGLDVKQLKLVVNYDAPNHLEDYVHRAGRTGRAGNTGTAVTFVTEEQENCAPGIAKALEQSGQPVPERLHEMRKAWKEKVKAGKAKDASGFGGKGLEKLDKEREAARMRERKTHKAEGDEEDFKEEEAKKEDKQEEKAQTAIKSAVSAIVSRDSVKAAAEVKSSAATLEPVASAIIKTSGPTPSAAAGAAKTGGALDKAASAISEINARLARAGQLRPGQPIDNKGPDAGAFHATLEINDFPQKARWAVTNRTNVAKILEATGTSITTKGNYYPAGKEPGPNGEPKLYILIEGDTELVVGNALSELTRLLKEGTMAAADAESRAPASGRYTIT